MSFLRFSIKIPKYSRIYSTSSKTSSDIYKLLQLARPHVKILSMAVGLLLVSSAVTMTVPFTMKIIIDQATDQSSIVDSSVDSNSARLLSSFKDISIPVIFTVLTGVFVIGASANFGRVVLFKCAGERIILDLRKKLYSSILHQDISFHDKNPAGELISRLSTDTVIVGKSVTSNISDGLRSAVMAFAGLGAMCLVNLKLTGIMMTIVPPIAMGAVLYGRVIRDVSRKTNDANAELTKLSEEKISNLRAVRAFSQENSEVDQYSHKVKGVYDLAMREGIASGIFFGSAGLSGNLVILALLYYGGSMVQAGELTVGSLTSFFLYTAYVGSSLVGISSWYSELMKGVGASTRLFSLLEEKSKIESKGGLVLTHVKGEIEFKSVSFSYPTRSNVGIFKGLCFKVYPGENIAIVGTSGSGKSTIAQLLLRFYDPIKGEIYIDGVPIQNLDSSWMREKVIGFVPQEPVLFGSSIKDNISYGTHDASDDQIAMAAKLANASEFIERLPMKFETLAGARGLALSGGQKQRIAIARALLKNPQILILDEATSALDATSEYLVQEALDNLINGRTVITIAHRLSTIKKSDRIIMIDGGKVVESGTFEELILKENGKFKTMIERQNNSDTNDE